MTNFEKQLIIKMNIINSIKLNRGPVDKIIDVINSCSLKEVKNIVNYDNHIKYDFDQLINRYNYKLDKE